MWGEFKPLSSWCLLLAPWALRAAHLDSGVNSQRKGLATRVGDAGLRRGR